MPPHQPDSDDDQLLKPREVADLFGVRPATIARWAREGKLSPLRTVGGHRRYTWAGIRDLLGGEAMRAAEKTDEQIMVEDAVRLYDQGWSIRQVAERFGCSYDAMRRILRKQVTLRTRSGRYPTAPGEY